MLTAIAAPHSHTHLHSPSDTPCHMCAAFMGPLRLGSDADRHCHCHRRTCTCTHTHTHTLSLPHSNSPLQNPLTALQSPLWISCSLALLPITIVAHACALAFVFVFAYAHAHTLADPLVACALADRLRLEPDADCRHHTCICIHTPSPTCRTPSPHVNCFRGHPVTGPHCHCRHHYLPRTCTCTCTHTCTCTCTRSCCRIHTGSRHRCRICTHRLPRRICTRTCEPLQLDPNADCCCRTRIRICIPTPTPARRASSLHAHVHCFCGRPATGP